MPYQFRVSTVVTVWVLVNHRRMDRKDAQRYLSRTEQPFNPRIGAGLGKPFTLPVHDALVANDIGFVDIAHKIR